jgi:hypothetical protein
MWRLLVDPGDVFMGQEVDRPLPSYDGIEQRQWS